MNFFSNCDCRGNCSVVNCCASSSSTASNSANISNIVFQQNEFPFSTHHVTQNTINSEILSPRNIFNSQDTLNFLHWAPTYNELDALLNPRTNETENSNFSNNNHQSTLAFDHEGVDTLLDSNQYVLSNTLNEFQNLYENNQNSFVFDSEAFEGFENSPNDIYYNTENNFSAPTVNHVNRHSNSNDTNARFYNTENYYRAETPHNRVFNQNDVISIPRLNQNTSLSTSHDQPIVYLGEEIDVDQLMTGSGTLNQNLPIHDDETAAAEHEMQNFVDSLKYVKFHQLTDTRRFKNNLYKHTSEAKVLTTDITDFPQVCNEIASFVQHGKQKKMCKINITQ